MRWDLGIMYAFGGLSTRLTLWTLGDIALFLVVVGIISSMISIPLVAWSFQNWKKD